MISSWKAAAKVTERVTFQYPPFPIAVALYPGTRSDAVLRIETTVKDRVDGSQSLVVHTFMLDLPIAKQDLLDFIEARCRAVFLHEFQESFCIGGQRVRDPHVFAGPGPYQRYELEPAPAPELRAPQGGNTYFDIRKSAGDPVDIIEGYRAASRSQP